MMFQFIAFFVAILCAFAVLSLPITAEAARLPALYRSEQSNHPAISRRDVFSPKITNPTAGTTWFKDSRVNVTWDTSNAPQNLTNTKGKLVLGFMNDQDDSEHLDMQNPLAQGFDILAGTMSFLVPDVMPGPDYIVVLFGDSGNRSPRFEIRIPEAGASGALDEVICAAGTCG
ncbi:hypothetical protein IW261DRAFT_613717 [Armillaria novae-zelandiae]|uniref:Uncharacterized protein n=1 Tax=Armillaria novae-zelandiae TaxID=153914 RepID=A0AA39UFM7_9AGAR|nr:hypothetical protein IW261DRAFT_613717 [Armillaria novae-zelandiae]